MKDLLYQGILKIILRAVKGKDDLEGIPSLLKNIEIILRAVKDEQGQEQ